MLDQIQTALSQIEDDDGVTILYACESASRAWGFASADSDYDVRFLTFTQDRGISQLTHLTGFFHARLL